MGRTRGPDRPPCGLADDLGETFTRGHLHNRASKTACLTASAHRIRFVYAPAPCRGLDEVERWFSELARAVLRRGSSESLDDLRQRVLDPIRSDTVVDAQPHRSRITADDLPAKVAIAT